MLSEVKSRREATIEKAAVWNGNCKSRTGKKPGEEEASCGKELEA
jgi:hypothetical protein